MTLHGRAQCLEQINAVPPAGPTGITFVTGPAGMGRSAVLAETGRLAAGRGRTVVSLTLSRHDRDTPYYVAGRLAAAISRLPVTVAAPTPATVARMHPVAAHIAAMMRARTGLLVLVDDVHLVDGPSRTVLAELARHLGPEVVRWVCSVRTPVRTGPGLPAAADDPGAAIMRDLVADRLARIVALPPLPRPAIADLVADVLGAEPHAELSHRVLRLCRGVPLAVVAAVESWTSSGALRVVGGHGYLTHLAPETTDPAASARCPLPAGLARTVAKAALVLHPTGDLLPNLAARVYGLEVTAVRAALRTLVAEGFLVPTTKGGWRFAVPLWAELVDRSLAPYERVMLARHLVETVWTGRADCPDEHLAEQLIRGGGGSQPQRAFADLLDLGTGQIRRHSAPAARRLAAAARLAPTVTGRRIALARHAVASAWHGDYDAAVQSTEQLLPLRAVDWGGVLPLPVALVHLTAVWGRGDIGQLERAAAGSLTFGHTAGHRVLCRGWSLTLLGRHDEAYRLLTPSRAQATTAADREYTELVLAVCGMFTGRPEHLSRLLANAGDGESTPPYALMIRTVVRTLLIAGDTPGAEHLLARERLVPQDLPAGDRMLLSWRRGRWDEAVHHARIATAMARDSDMPAPHYGIAPVLIGRGRLNAAREALAVARRTQPRPLSHLLDVMDVAIARILGDDELARRHLRDGLAAAGRNRILTGTESLWLDEAKLALKRGDRQRARAALAAVAEVAEKQQTERSRLLAQLTRLAVEPESGTAAEVLALARRLGQPDALSRSLIAVVEAGGPPALLQEAYDTLEPLQALLYRHRLRQLMRSYQVPVPGRNTTRDENDRLLATLVAEGASNRELATIMMASGKSVENMLTRLFTRTGYRGRVDLAAAVLTGAFPTT